jgi:hypothetical protein
MNRERRSPDLDIITIFHRNEDSYACFKLKRGTFRSFGTVKVPWELKQAWPKLARALDRDGMMMLNGCYCGIKHDYTEGLKCLNACYLRLLVSGGDPRLGLERKLSQIEQLVSKGEIPQPSLLVWSAPRLWIFWLLQEIDGSMDAPSGDPKYHWRAFGLWRRIQYELRRHFKLPTVNWRTKQDGFDWIPVPGSLFSDNQQRATLLPYFDDQWELRHYTIPELARSVGIKTQGTDNVLYAEPDENEPRLKYEVHRTGRRPDLCVNESRLKQLDKLATMRWRFDPSVASKALFLYAVFFRIKHWDNLKSRSKKYVERFIAHLVCGTQAAMISTISRRGAFKIIRAAERYTPAGFRMSNAKIADLLDITPEEAKRLDTWPPASRFLKTGAVKQPGPNQRERKQARRALVRAYVRKHTGEGEVTIEQVRRFLKKKGIEASMATVGRDIQSARNS